MAARLYVCEELAERVGRGAAWPPPAADGAGGDVLVATPAALAGWQARGGPRDLLVVVGDGPLPAGAAPWLTLPAGAGGSAIALAVDAALEVAALRDRVDASEGAAALERSRQLDLARVGIALAAERDLDRLLGLILSTARDLVSADAGSVFIVEDGSGPAQLRFALAQNDSVATALTRATLPADSASIAGHAARSGEPVLVDDVRWLPAGLPYRFNESFDLTTGYHTRSVLTTPMSTRAGEVVGVLQLINRKRDPSAKIRTEADADALVLPFGESDVAVIRALAAHAAVAIENTRLVQEVEGLFEGFVRAAVTAIEQRDPSTSGHSLRVAHYTVLLAQALGDDPRSAYHGTRFTDDQLTELRYAALLHDFGKVGVREAVLTKAKKLGAERLGAVQERFRHARTARAAALQRLLLHSLGEQQRPPAQTELAELERSASAIGTDLDAGFAAVLAANEPTPLPRPTGHLLGGVARQRFVGADGAEEQLLLPEEVRALSVPIGSLDEEERREVESHVVHSYQFLLTLPWPRRYARVAEIAYGHHEKLNGRGYPSRLAGEQISLEARIIAVCDIYDALAAGDRPYKRAVSPEQAIAELEREAAAGFLDADLVRTFVDSRVWARPPAPLVQ